MSGPRHVILGTAGHIDHGKTSLVRALTGVDTDRLQEEKARGITIELGFAEMAGDADRSIGVVDVPGHEAFVRAMVAGATGVDVILLVVAADEGVMPQTREHLAVVDLLGVSEMVVALTKSDLVEEEWLDLVAEEVEEALSETRFVGAPIIPTHTLSDDGVDALRAALLAAADGVERRRSDDLVRLPVDRVFTVQGTGTVVTGTLWSGTLRSSESVRVLPDDSEARVRGLQIHGRATGEVEAGTRTAVALTGPGADRERLARGATLVTHPTWKASRMLTARIRVLPDTGWSIEHNQRVHVHLGTQVVLARCAPLQDSTVPGGEEAWVQLRLEEPVAARVGDRVILRAYSPVTTIAGGPVAEVHPPKRRKLDVRTAADLDAVLDGDSADSVSAALRLAGWAGMRVADTSLHAPLTRREAVDALASVVASGGTTVGERAFATEVVTSADDALMAAVDAEHDRHPLEARIRRAVLRTALPEWVGPGLADARLDALGASGRLDIDGSGLRRADHTVHLSEDQERAAQVLAELYREADLAPPALADLPDAIGGRSDLLPLIRHLEATGVLSVLDDGVWIDSAALTRAADDVRTQLAGGTSLGPSEFREVLPVTRRHLMPLLAFLDRTGVTIRRDGGRDVCA